MEIHGSLEGLKPPELMQNSMHILVLNYEYPPVGGGAGVVTQHICRHLSSLGIKQTVITGWIPGLDFYSKDGDVDIIRVPMLKSKKHKTSFLGFFSYLLSSFLPMIAVILFGRVTLIHAHFAIPVGALAFAAKFLLGIPYVITLHGGDVPGMVPEQTDFAFKFAKPFAIRIVKKATSVTAVSVGLKDLALKSYPCPIEVIHNGIDNAMILESLAQKNRRDSEIRLLFAGRFTHQKNIESLLEAARIMENKGIKYQLKILGDGPLFQKLENTAVGLKNIHFFGWVDEEGVRNHMLKSDIFILPSFSEGLSITALQAMASGCALVLSNIPMNVDLLDEGENGWFSGHDPQSIADSILKCSLSLEKLQLGSLKKAHEFTWDRIGNLYLDLFNSVEARR